MKHAWQNLDADLSDDQIGIYFIIPHNFAFEYYNSKTMKTYFRKTWYIQDVFDFLCR